jgi:hypothetical protein
MTIKDYLKAKTSTKDLVEIKGIYFESRRFKEYLKALKGLNYEIWRCSTLGQLIIEYPQGRVTFKSVDLIEYIDSDNVKYSSHSFDWKWSDKCNDAVKTYKQVIGKAHSIEL